jgi:hypothetical protein
LVLPRDARRWKKTILASTIVNDLGERFHANIDIGMAYPFPALLNLAMDKHGYTSQRALEMRISYSDYLIGAQHSRPMIIKAIHLYITVHHQRSGSRCVPIDSK